jgi:hypothetical protein
MNEVFDGELRGLVYSRVFNERARKTEETPLAHTEVSPICLYDSVERQSMACLPRDFGVCGCARPRLDQTRARKRIPQQCIAIFEEWVECGAHGA